MTEKKMWNMQFTSVCRFNWCMFSTLTSFNLSIPVHPLWALDRYIKNIPVSFTRVLLF